MRGGFLLPPLLTVQSTLPEIVTLKSPIDSVSASVSYATAVVGCSVREDTG